MAKNQLTNEQKQLLELFDKAKSSTVDGLDVKAIVRSLRKSRDFLNEAIDLLEGGQHSNNQKAVERDENAPYGYTKDGVPKKPPGRAAKKQVTGTDQQGSEQQ